MIAFGCVILKQPWEVVRRMTPRQLSAIMETYREIHQQKG